MAYKKVEIRQLIISTLGFLEVLDDLGNKSDVAGIASKQGLELDDLLPIFDSGEMLRIDSSPSRRRIHN